MHPEQLQRELRTRDDALDCTLDEFMGFYVHDIEQTLIKTQTWAPVVIGVGEGHQGIIPLPDDILTARDAWSTLMKILPEICKRMEFKRVLFVLMMWTAPETDDPEKASLPAVRRTDREMALRVMALDIPTLSSVDGLYGWIVDEQNRFAGLGPNRKAPPSEKAKQAPTTPVRKAGVVLH